MNRYWLLVGFAYLVCLPAQAQISEAANIIEINGQAYIDVQPDLAIVTASISHLSSSLASSKEEVDNVYIKAVKAMQNLNIEAKDIKGENLRAYPELVLE